MSTTLPSILVTFPSVRPPLSRLIEHLSHIQPRYYSVTSSHLEDKNSVKIAFTIVKEGGFGVGGQGLCTGWLENHSLPTTKEITSNSSFLPSIPIPIFPKPSGPFQMPSDSTIPLVMIGPGTGIAPFMSFLSHRHALKNQKKDIILGKTLLIHGCRNLEQDFLFKKEIDNYIQSGVLNVFEVCVSRHLDGTKKKGGYVTDGLISRGAEIWEMLNKEEGKGSLFVCGGAAMMRSVNDALLTLVKEHGKGIDPIEWTISMMKSGRYLRDIWG